MKENVTIMGATFLSLPRVILVSENTQRVKCDLFLCIVRFGPHQSTNERWNVDAFPNDNRREQISKHTTLNQKGKHMLWISAQACGQTSKKPLQT